jgi:succinyl-diaminopimelate desuccinylase
VSDASAAIDARADELVRFTADLIRRPSPNPPGDTREVAAHVAARLAHHGIAVEEVSDQVHTPNLVATVEGARPGPHLVLCGHMDVYPPGPEELWMRDPFGGEIADGRLHGRGAGDMKSGLATLVYAMIAHAEAGDVTGRLSLLAVSDEMSFSPHGAPLVLERRPDLTGDAVIGAEPTSPDFVLFGEKGMAWIELRAEGGTGAGAYAAGVPNAIERLAAAIGDLASLRDWEIPLPADVAEALRTGGGTSGLPPEALTYADDRVLPLVTVNAGTISGGRKINLVADEARCELDLRLPPGGDLAELHERLDGLLGRHPGVSRRVIQEMPPNHTDPGDPLVRALVDAGAEVRGVPPRPELGITASDTRLWRARGVPAAMIGPRIAGQGMPNESSAVADIVDCARIVTRAVGRILG